MQTKEKQNLSTRCGYRAPNCPAKDYRVDTLLRGRPKTRPHKVDGISSNPNEAREREGASLSPHSEAHMGQHLPEKTLWGDPVEEKQKGAHMGN